MAAFLAIILALLGLAHGTWRPAVAPVRTLHLGPGRAGIIGVDPVTNRVFLAEETAPAIVVIDGETFERLSAIPTAGYHAGMAVDPVAHRTYVAQSFEHRLKRIDGRSLSGDDLEVPGLVNAMGALAVDPEGRRLFVARNDNGDVAVFDTATGAFLRAVCPGCCAPACLAATFDPASRQAFLANQVAGQVIAIGSPGGEVTARIAVDGGPHDLAVNSRTGRLYVSPSTARQVVVIDVAPGSPSENHVVGAVAVPEITNGIAVDPSRDRVYVAHSAADTITVVDGARAAVERTLATCEKPAVLAVLPGLGRVFVSCNVGAVVAVLEDRAPVRR